MQAKTKIKPESYPDVSVVVLNWERADDTIECLESLLVQDYPGAINIVICDNNSRDDSRARLRAWCESHSQRNTPGDPESGTTNIKLFLIGNEENRGYAAGNNAGIRFTLEKHKPEFIWILNNDTVAKKNCLLNLSNFTQARPDCGVIGSVVTHYHNPKTIQAYGGGRYIPGLSISWHLGAGYEVGAFPPSGRPVRPDYIYGASMFLRADILRTIGLYNESFFLYFEELDFARRLANGNYKQAVCDNCYVSHKQGASIQETAGSTWHSQQMRAYHENLSCLLFTFAHHPLHLPLVMLTRFFAKFVLHIARGEAALIPVVTRAFFDFLRNPRRPKQSVKPINIIFPT